jgi:hypothetical protein
MDDLGRLELLPMSDLASVAVGGGIGVLGALVGAVANASVTERHHRRQFRVDTALQLPETELQVWSPWAEFEASRRRLDAQLRVCGVPTGLIETSDKLLKRCWAYQQRAQELYEEPGISTELLDALTLVNAAIATYLTAAGSQRRRTRDASVALSHLKQVIPSDE